MPTLKDVAADLAAVLEGAGLGLTRAENLFVGPIPADEQMPSLGVFVLATGGSQTPYLGSRGGLAEPSVQVRVRGDREGFLAAQQLAFGIYEALHLTQPAGYVSVEAHEGQPYYLGDDVAGRPLFTMNFDARYVPGA